MSFKNTYIHNALVAENEFRTQLAENKSIPLFSNVKEKLPQIFWDNHQSTIDCYWKAWDLGFSNLRKPTKQSGFVSNYIDTAYNGNIFMWDSCFMTMFGVYGRRVFDFQGTLDNFYAKQHPDGFICREIEGETGNDLFHRHDHVSTGPNILPWAEWEYYQRTGDNDRLEKIFPVLVAYHQWLMHYRTWPDGSYFSSGWGTGMDNQPRLDDGYHWNYSHGHMTWLDTTLQQIISGQVLMQIGEVLERWQEIEPIMDETEFLIDFVNKKLFSNESEFYHDRYKNGDLNKVKSIGAYWGLLAKAFPTDRVDSLIRYLKDERYFKRSHMIPSLSYDDNRYQAKGRYWQGGVWAPTNYMVLKGLETVGEYRLGFEIASNHVQNVVKVFENTGTLWENYAPESVNPATPSKKDFVGWTGLAPISVLIEDVFGIKADVSENTIHWHVNLEEDAFGVSEYPFGLTNQLSLKCTPDPDGGFPYIEASSLEPVVLIVYTNNETKTFQIS